MFNENKEVVDIKYDEEKNRGDPVSPYITALSSFG